MSVGVASSSWFSPRAKGISNALDTAWARDLSTSRIQRTSAPIARSRGRWDLNTMPPAPMMPIVLLGLMYGFGQRIYHPTKRWGKHVFVIKLSLKISNRRARCRVVRGEDDFYV